MLRSYIKIAWRNIRKYPGYSIQNIISLSVALAVAILTIVYITNEFSYDKHYNHSERIFRLNADLKLGDQEIHSAQSGDQFGPLLAGSFTEIERYVRFFKSNTPIKVRKGDRFLKETNAVFVDSSLLTVFNFKMAENLSSGVFSEPNTVMITKSMAHKYFGGQTAVGRTLEIEEISHGIQKSGSYKVVGVLEDFVNNSHFKFDFFFPITALDYGWGNYAGSHFNTYVQVSKDFDYHSVDQRLKSIVQTSVFPAVSKQLGINQTWGNFIASGNQLEYSLFPMEDIHLYSNREGELGQNSTIQTMYILIALSLFVLVMAAVNYINLATSRAIGRTREVGLRKVLGSSRGSLVFQFLSESIVLVCISAVVAFLIGLSLLPVFNGYLSTSLLFQDFFQPRILLYIVLVVVSIGILSGTYPAFFLSKFKIANAIKGVGTSQMSGNLLRKYLIVGQLTISIVLVLSAFILNKQLQYVQRVDVGYNKDQVLIVSNVGSLGDQAKAFKHELSNISGIDATSLTGIVPVNSSKLTGNYAIESGKTAHAALPIRTWWVDEGFLETLDIPMLEGNDFSRIPIENQMKVIVNEEAIKVLGIQNPIGKKIYSEGDRNYIISGVVKNFNYESLREKIGPVILLYSEGSTEQYAAIRTSAESDLSTILGEMNKVWSNLHTDEKMEYYFLDEAFNSLYHQDQLISKIGLSIALLAVIIACIGLLGTISFATERRKKEIGVRKVFGASVYAIVNMISKDFFLLVILSWLIASPIAWWIMNTWLQDFAYRIDMEWWMFALAGISAIGLALMTVSFQAVKAAMANPVDSLRDE